MARTVVLSVRISEDLHKDLKEAAAADERSVSWYIARILQRAIEDKKREERPKPKPPG